jgi:hypothetical protein
MAFYRVRIGGVDYANKELFAALKGKSRNEISLLSLCHKVNYVTILDTPLYPLSKEDSLRSARDMRPEEQDIDKQLRMFSPMSKEELLDAGAQVIDLVHRDSVEVLTIGSKRFVRFSSVAVSGIYNRKDRIPTIKMCSSLYIVTGHAIKGKEKDTLAFTI